MSFYVLIPSIEPLSEHDNCFKSTRGAASIKSIHLKDEMTFYVTWPTEHSAGRVSQKELTNSPVYSHGVVLFKLRASELQFHLLSGDQKNRGVAGNQCVINPADRTHRTLIHRQTSGHHHSWAFVRSHHHLQAFWRNRSDRVRLSITQRCCKLTHGA